jgi:hypothetical protein
MSAQAAGGMLMWLAGVTLGVSAMAPNYSGLGLGSFLSIMGIVYIKRFSGRQ